MDYVASSAEQTLKHLTSSNDGLSSAEVERRLKAHGPNELRIKRTRSWVKDVVEPFKSVFVLILIVAAVISAVLGKPVDAVVIMAIVVVNAIIFYAQRFTANRALAALSRRDRRAVKVWRGGQVMDRTASELVPGDIVLLLEGLKVPADGRVLVSEGLLSNESMLTGESLPVAKQVEPLPAGRQIYDQANMVFQGSFIASGSGRYVVTATGNHTEMARIAKLSQDEEPASPLQRKIDHLTVRVVILAVSASVLAFGLGLYRGIPIGEMLRFALSMTVSAVPEGLPVALTIVLVFSIQRMARQKALVRNLMAVETLGQTTMIATDKTGTLTKNQLAIAQHWYPASSDQPELERVARLALAHESHHHTDDPLEQVLATQLPATAPSGWKRFRALPFNQQLRMSGSIWQDGKEYVYAIKGAAEAVAQACKLPAAQSRVVHEAIKRLSADGFRLIAFASARSQQAPPAEFKQPPTGLQFEGIIAFADGLRPEIPSAILATQQAGIKVLMVTGDHLETAAAIGVEAGIISSGDQAVEGQAISKSSLTQIRQLLKRVRVFGRVLPEHKYRILEAVEGREITAMTGDGVNDVPAIVKANVGLAMGAGTDAAKEAADVILLDNNYATIVVAVREGRALLANARKMVFYLFATNLGEVLVMLGALIVGLPLPLTALHVLWVNMVTDGFTVIPLGLEPAEKHQMQRPPENMSAPLLRRNLLMRVISTALVMATLTLAVFWLYLPSGLQVAQSLAFATLIVIQWANVLNARSEQSSFLAGCRRPNYKLYAAIAVSAGLQALVFWGPLREVLGVVAPTPGQLWVLAAAVVATLVAGDFIKKAWR